MIKDTFKGKEVKMRKYGFFVSLIAVVILIAGLSGCDNRSQLEKDVDSAAAKVKNVLK